MKKNIDYDEILNAIRETNSMRSASIKLNIKYTTFIRWCKKFGLYKPNQGNRGFTKEDGRTSGKKQIPLEDILIENSKYTNSCRLKERLIKYGYLQNKCYICCITEWNHLPIVLQLDHINGINTDNRIENLRLLCPNCHSQTDNFCRSINSSKRIHLTDEEIIDIITNSYTISSVLTKIGVTGGERNYKKIREIMKKYRIKLKEKIVIEFLCKNCGKQLRRKNITMLCKKCYYNSLKPNI